ncbi:MAG TPA: FHA domain-containing protein, partial [Rhodothermales bacterium]|nr:FHA domain-containing protein [Rhodothermales bacterium]
MMIRLLVSRTSGSPHPNEYTFDQESIILGRDSASHLALPDPQRVVSKRHAEIRCQHDTVQLLDLGSKNFTYLNERKLQPGIPYELHGGDAIRVGEFEILYEPVLLAEADYDRTIFDASFVNPFEEDAERLATAWRSIREKFE